MEPLALGPFVIPGYVAEAAIAVVAGLAVMLILTLKDRTRRGAGVDLVSTALVVYVLLWKLGPLFSTPQAVLGDPRLLLFARGGTAGVVAGAVGAAVYLAVALKRRKLMEPRMLVALGAFLLATGGVYGLTQVMTAPRGGTAAEGRASGRPRAPAFELERLAGGSFSLEDGQGKPVVINFWATWCGPCRAETPVKKRLWQDLAGRAHFVGVNLTTSEGGVGEVRDYVEELGITYPILLDRTGRVQQRYAVRGTPTTYIIDAEGRVVHRFMGAMSYRDMKRRVEALLPEEGG